MKARLCFAAAACLAAALYAQDRPATQSPSTNPAAQSQPDTKHPTDQDNKMTGKGAPAEMKTQSYKGVLVDMSCAGGGSQPATANSPSAGEQKTNTADRTASGAGQSCAPSASSTQLGLKMQDGRTLRFDLVGNQRAQDELKNNKKWTQATSSGKEIQAKISGAMSGDKLIVSSIH